MHVVQKKYLFMISDTKSSELTKYLKSIFPRYWKYLNYEQIIGMKLLQQFNIHRVNPFSY